MATKLYVGNLSFRTTSEELREAFAAVGTVESASVIEDRETGRSRGFAFVEMATPEAFNGKDFGGRNLTVNEAKPRTDRGGGGGRGGYGGGRGGGGGGRGGYGGGGGGGGRDNDRYEREPRW
jgi:RNA recognition motif-containing protein